MELYAKDKDPKEAPGRQKVQQQWQELQAGGRRRGQAGGCNQSVEDNEAEGTNAPSTTSSRRTYLDYRWILAVPENLVWLTLGPLLFLAARLRNTTLLAIGGLPPGMVSQVGDFLTKGLEKVNLFASALVFQEAKYEHLFDNSLFNE